MDVDVCGMDQHSNFLLFFFEKTDLDQLSNLGQEVKHQDMKGSKENVALLMEGDLTSLVTRAEWFSSRFLVASWNCQMLRWGPVTPVHGWWLRSSYIMFSIIYTLDKPIYAPVCWFLSSYLSWFKSLFFDKPEPKPCWLWLHLMFIQSYTHIPHFLSVDSLHIVQLRFTVHDGHGTELRLRRVGVGEVGVKIGAASQE